MAATDGDYDALKQSGLPLFYRFPRQAKQGFASSLNRHGLSVRVWARSLSGMQKEAVVMSPRTTDLWRLASDEGPYLKGFDSAPCPLAFFTTGLVASSMEEVRSLAAKRGITLTNIALVVDNFYSMEGSALRGTMQGGALSPRIKAWIDSSASDHELNALLRDGILASPVYALVRKPLKSLFTLTVNGARVANARVPSVDTRRIPDANLCFDSIVPSSATDQDTPSVCKLTDIETRHGVAGGYATSLAARQKRKLHIRGTCHLSSNGLKEIRQDLYSPLGSSFRFRSDEVSESTGSIRAPDAASYAAAGIAFCFMTQLGRYAQIVKHKLADYRVIQDVHFSPGGNGPGDVDAVETHLHLQGPIDPQFARTLLDMGEQTCFLHALCRTELDMHIECLRGTEALKEPVS